MVRVGLSTSSVPTAPGAPCGQSNSVFCASPEAAIKNSSIQFDTRMSSFLRPQGPARIDHTPSYRSQAVDQAREIQRRGPARESAHNKRQDDGAKESAHLPGRVHYAADETCPIAAD